MKKVKKHIAKLMMVAIFFLAPTLAVLADQAAYLTEKQAADAMLALKPVQDAKKSIMHYCDPCGEDDKENGKIEGTENNLVFFLMGKK